MNDTRVVSQPGSVKAQNKFFLLLYSPLPPIQCWKVTQQFPTKTVPFLNQGGGGMGREAKKT